MVSRVFVDYDVQAFFTNRWGGVSKAPYDDFNLAFHVGDNVSDVLKNREILAEKEKLDVTKIIYMQQVHSNNIQVIDKLSSLPKDNEIKNCDGIITNLFEISLMVMVADCIPILLYDKSKNVIAAIHAGRNGTFLKIVSRAVSVMQEKFDTNPSDIMAAFGPSIQKSCYEVDNSLANICIKNFGRKYVFYKNDSYFLDLQQINKDLLLEKGVKEENIFISPICTHCDFNYFSYRRQKITGRFVGVIKLK